MLSWYRGWLQIFFFRRKGQLFCAWKVREKVYKKSEEYTNSILNPSARAVKTIFETSPVYNMLRDLSDVIEANRNGRCDPSEQSTMGHCPIESALCYAFQIKQVQKPIWKKIRIKRYLTYSSFYNFLLFSWSHGECWGVILQALFSVPIYLLIDVCILYVMYTVRNGHCTPVRNIEKVCNPAWLAT